MRADDWQYYFEDGLAEIEYSLGNPFQLRLSPLLGVVRDDAFRGGDCSRHAVECQPGRICTSL